MHPSLRLTQHPEHSHSPLECLAQKRMEHEEQQSNQTKRQLTAGNARLETDTGESCSLRRRYTQVYAMAPRDGVQTLVRVPSRQREVALVCAPRGVDHGSRGRAIVVGTLCSSNAYVRRRGPMQACHSKAFEDNLS